MKYKQIKQLIANVPQIEAHETQVSNEVQTNQTSETDQTAQGLYVSMFM